jgi:glycolate oxidase iron-sulfur subunit
MQTLLTSDILSTEAGREAEAILRNCVHCGFCTATCPTYQILGSELDGPRGRIYLVKQMLEGAAPTDAVQLHLDRCLLCRACETTCPSGVDYSRLLEFGRQHLHQHLPRRLRDRSVRWLLRKVLPKRSLFAALVALGSALKPILPAAIGRTIPQREAINTNSWPTQQHRRKMLILDGCVQPSLAPGINLATAQVLDRLGISLIRTPQAGCCGAVEHHLDDHDASRQAARRNIDQWWPLLQDQAEALIITASGCAQMVKTYDQLLADDPDYAAKAKQLVNRCKDIAEVIQQEDLTALKPGMDQQQLRIAFHASCTLQHGQKLSGVVEAILTRMGYSLTPVNESHLCCGSAGTYSILQPKIADQLGQRKTNMLLSGGPQLIATANIGCLSQLLKTTPDTIPVVHWIELLAPASIEAIRKR